MSRGKTDNLFFSSKFDLLVDRWSRTQDDETLAQLVELSPPGGRMDLGRAIAAKLRLKRPDQKASIDQLWREIDRVFRFQTLENGKTSEEAYLTIKAIYFADESEDRYDIKTIERQHLRWAKRAEAARQNF